jgi:hypothetical protein
MNVEMDEESKKWLESKGKQLTVKALDIKGCCSPGVQDVAAVPGKPKNLNHYNEFKVDNISIYVQKSFCRNEKLTLKLSGIRFLKSISAKLQ